MARPCLVCTDLKRSTIDALLSTGASDYEVGRRFNLERVSVGRHRRRHLIKPARDRLAILAKDSTVRQHREQFAAAAAYDAPTPAQFVEAFFGLKAQAEKLQRIEDRLERVAVLAEESASPNAVAQVAAQQMRGIEVCAKIAGVGAYAPARASDPGAGGQTFAVNILFSNGETVSIATTPGAAPTAEFAAGEDADEEHAEA
jgi:hypothetical protein